MKSIYLILCILISCRRTHGYLLMTSVGMIEKICLISFPDGIQTPPRPDHISPRKLARFLWTSISNPSFGCWFYYMMDTSSISSINRYKVFCFIPGIIVGLVCCDILICDMMCRFLKSQLFVVCWFFCQTVVTYWINIYNSHSCLNIILLQFLNIPGCSSPNNLLLGILFP